jgi:Na+/melibiose symporter-like transporter
VAVIIVTPQEDYKMIITTLALIGLTSLFFIMLNTTKQHAEEERRLQEELVKHINRVQRNRGE